MADLSAIFLIFNNAGTLKQEFVITDQQGNARVSFHDNGSGVAVVMQENSYYAFGMIMPNSPVTPPAIPNKNLYNGGSEWQNDYPNNLPDYYQTYFRNYDAALGRFVGIDPQADGVESLTGYQYVGNNPIMFNDPLGNKAIDFGPQSPSSAFANEVAQDIGNGAAGFYAGGVGGGGGGGAAGLAAWEAMEASPEYQDYLTALSHFDAAGDPFPDQIAASQARTAAAQTAGATSSTLSAQLNTAYQQVASKNSSISYIAGKGYRFNKGYDATATYYGTPDGKGSYELNGVNIVGYTSRIDVAANQGADPSSKWQQFKDGVANDLTVFAMTAEWAVGANMPHVFINDRVTADLSKSPGVAAARDLYYKTGKTSGYASFGAAGYWESGFNPIAQFVGGFKYQISVVGGNLEFFITNVTSMHSLLLDKTPNSWNPVIGPGSNMTQFYFFTEPLRK